MCLTAGVYLLVVLHHRDRRPGHVLSALGVGVLAVYVVPDYLLRARAASAAAAHAVAYAAAGVLIVAGVLLLTRDREQSEAGSPATRALLVLGATIALASGVITWALPFSQPLQDVLGGGAGSGSLVALEGATTVAVAAAWLACAWIVFEQRPLGTELSRMLAVTLSLWAIALLVDVTALVPAAAAGWVSRGLHVLGSIVLARALTVHVLRDERAARRRDSLELVERVTREAIRARRLSAVLATAAETLQELVGADVVGIYLERGETGVLELAHAVGMDAELPPQIGVDDEHAAARAYRLSDAVRLQVRRGGRSHGENAVAVPLSDTTGSAGVLVVAVTRPKMLDAQTVQSLSQAAEQLGLIVRQMMVLEEMRQEGDRWRKTFDAITELVTVHDRQGRITAANAAMLHFAGMTASEAEGSLLPDLLGQPCGEQELLLTGCVESGTPPDAALHRVRGRVHQVQVMPLSSEEGEVVGSVRVARDVTSRWRAEERLAQSERRYRELAENANDIIYTHDLDGNFLYVNRAAVEILGYSASELAELSFWEIIAPESIDAARAYVERLLGGTAEREQVELRMQGADERPVIVQLRANLLRRHGEREMVQGIARDVSAEKELAAQLMQADRLASVGTLIAGIAHELNNPLTTITGYADLLMDSLRGTEDEFAAMTVRQEAQRCARVAQNLFNFARQDEERMIEFDLNMLIRGVRDLLAYELRAASIEVECDLAEDLPRIIADHGQIQQLVYNLMDNAYDALQEQGGGQIRVSTWQDEDLVRVQIDDDGPGLRVESAEQAFEPFYTTKSPDEGAGLGLSICRRIARGHGGRILAEPNDDGGARFTLSLPLDATQALCAARDSTKKENRPMAHGRLLPPEDDVTRTTGRVLFIDDEPSLCELIDEYLSRLGHEVTIAHDGEEGLRIAREEDFDLIICDMRMPGMSGQELCARLTAERPELVDRIIVVTGDILNSQTQDFFTTTGLPHIHKPFKLDQLDRIIDGFLVGEPVTDR